DIYALGCVLYEMLAGEPPFTGPTAQAIVAKVVSGEATRVTAYRKSVPPNIEAAVQCALAKVPADRFGSAAAVAAALSNAAFVSGSITSSTAIRHPGRWAKLAGALAIVSAVLWGITVRDRDHTSAAMTEGRVARFTLDLSDSAPAVFIGAAALGNGRRAFAISPDGQTLVYAGRHNGLVQLYVRPLDSYEVRPLPGTEGAYGPFFSPNGQWVGFFV